jgi:hypothetical protein
MRAALILSYAAIMAYFGMMALEIAKIALRLPL